MYKEPFLNTEGSFHELSCDDVIRRSTFIPQHECGVRITMLLRSQGTITHLKSLVRYQKHISKAV